MPSREIAIVLKEFDRGVENVVKGLVLGTTANLKMAAGEGGTPVDTGWARANWLPSVRQPINATAGTQEEAKAGNVDFTQSMAGEGSVAFYKLSMGKAFISNNVPYIEQLNAGSSPQAQAGFVERAIQKTIDTELARGFRTLTVRL